MKMFPFFRARCTVLAACLLFTGCALAQSPAPLSPHNDIRIASPWPAQNTIIAMLGYGKNIVGTSAVAKQIPLFRAALPGIVAVPDISVSSGHEINPEQVIGVHAQVVFIPQNMHLAQQDTLTQAGIKVMALQANSLSALVERVMLTAQALGPDAVERARRYQTWYQNNVALVRERLAAIPPAQRVTVYHAMMSPLITSGRPSLNQDWMDLAGAKNIAEAWFSGKKNSTGEVTVEKIAAANPDVIVTMTSQGAQQILHDPQWQGINAVKKHRVLVNPQGMFWWCRETSEEGLQFVWLAKMLYPTYFSDIDMVKMTRDFYQQFFNLTLTDTQINQILNP